MDDCELSFVAGRLQVDFSRHGKLVQSRVLDVEAVERLADQLDDLDDDGLVARLFGGVSLEREHAHRVSQQLRALASVLRVARDLWSAGQETVRTPRRRPRPPHKKMTAPPTDGSAHGRIRLIKPGRDT